MHTKNRYGSGHCYYTVEIWRGAALNIWHAGTDDVYIFNFLPRQQ